MNISFYRSNNVIELLFDVLPNEFHYENEYFHLFIDSNLPPSVIRNKCQEIENNNFNDILAYLKQDGIILIYNKVNGAIILSRDESGLNSIYYYKTENELFFSSISHFLAKKLELPLLESSIIQWLTFDYLWDGQVLYESLIEPLVGETLYFNEKFEIIDKEQERVDFYENENFLTENENIAALREAIKTAHALYVRENNIVFLSGGIDSVAMLIALDDLVSKNAIESHSFRVEGTLQDETEYAKSISGHLGTKLKIINRDVSKEINNEIFKKEILKYNNPYPGVWIFSNQINSSPNNIYYAGQDTRLHTPALNFIDKIAFRFFELGTKSKLILAVLNVLFMPLRLILDFAFEKAGIKHRVLRGLRRFFYCTDTEKYVGKYYFKLDKSVYRSLKLPDEFYKKASKKYVFNLTHLNSRRKLYNYIVTIKWTEQYVNDIRYMVDMVKSHGGRLAMPFYSIPLAKFSASIPFNMAIKEINGKSAFSGKKVKINKFILREALKDKIDDKTYYREKAVSSTFHIIFNQVLGKILKEIIVEDLTNKLSVIKRFKLESFIELFLKKQNSYTIDDDSYLLKIHNLCCVIIYAKEVNYKIVEGKFS